MTATTLTISKDSDVITFINLFTVQSEEEQQQLIDLLIKATEEVMCNQEGFVSANIHKSLDDKHVVNYEQWKNKESFENILRNTKASYCKDKHRFKVHQYYISQIRWIVDNYIALI